MDELSKGQLLCEPKLAKMIDVAEVVSFDFLIRYICARFQTRKMHSPF